MAQPQKRLGPTLARVELLTLLLLGAIAFAVLLPRCRPQPASSGIDPAQNAPKPPAAKP